VEFSVTHTHTHTHRHTHRHTDTHTHTYAGVGQSVSIVVVVDDGGGQRALSLLLRRPIRTHRLLLHLHQLWGLRDNTHTQKYHTHTHTHTHTEREPHGDPVQTKPADTERTSRGSSSDHTSRHRENITRIQLRTEQHT